MNPNHSQNQGKWMAFAALGYKEGDLVTSWQLDREESNPRLITNWLEVYPEEIIDNES